MKKNYQQPAMRIVRIQHNGVICASQTTATQVSGNVFNNNIEAGNGTARGRQVDIWGDEDDEEGMN